MAMPGAASFRAAPTTPDQPLPALSSRGSSRGGSRDGGLTGTFRPDSRGSIRRHIGPAGFGKQVPYEGPPTPTLPSSLMGSEPEWRTSKSGLEYYLPFKLFRSASTEPSYQPSPARIDRSHTSMGLQEVHQMDCFVSDTAQAMVGFHASKCQPIRGPGEKNPDVHKLETLSDLMKKHKDAFHREYEEFGPVSEWTPDSNSSALPISGAARDLGKHFDLRGELATIQHVRRAQCRLRSPSPLLLNRMNTPYIRGKPQNTQQSQPTSKPKQQQQQQQSWRSEPKQFARIATPATPDHRFPRNLQVLYLPPARTGIAVVESTPTQTQG